MGTVTITQTFFLPNHRYTCKLSLIIHYLQGLHFGSWGVMIPGRFEEMIQHVKWLWFSLHGGVQLNVRFDDLGSSF